MAIPGLEPKILPLQQINIPTRPVTKRSIAISPDGDLAVAGDNTVFISVPEFPRWNDALQDVDAPADEDLAVQPEVDDKAKYGITAERTQYSGSFRTMRVSDPPLDPRVNRELFAAAKLPVPWDESILPEVDENGLNDADGDDGEEPFFDVDGNISGEDDDGDLEDDEDDDDEDDDDDDDDDDAAKLVKRARPNTMNHFINMAWSPSGLGLNGRPVLAVQTADGTVGIYGDGRKDEIGGRRTKADADMVPSRSLDLWARLWGFGGRLLVPGQEALEEVKSFAWARDLGPGRALLAYKNGRGQVVVLCVQTVEGEEEGEEKKGEEEGGRAMHGHANGADEHANGNANGHANDTGMAGEMVWQVREVARFAVKGPHPETSVLDPDWVPTGTSYGVTWGPWLLGQDGSRTCLLSFIEKNYVGFRKITVGGDWVKGDLPRVTVAEDDAYGLCVHLSTDAFVEFENAVWNRGDCKTNRGYVATPNELEFFEVAVVGGYEYYQCEAHSTEDCETTYLSEDEEPGSTNPIMGLIIHPVDPQKPPPTPIYTLIRLAATSTNKDWYETNSFLSSDSVPSPKPQWADIMQNLLDVTMTADMNMRHGFDRDDDSAGSGDDVGDIDDMDDDDDDDFFDLDHNDDGEASGPQMHPNRFLLWGLATSPGAGVTAVVASKHNTQLAWRASWRLLRSMVLFSHHPRSDDALCPAVFSPTPTSHRYALSTEGRAFEWMYGGGPDVPGLTCPRGADDDDAEFAARRALFAPAVQAQRCPVCGSVMARKFRGAGRLMTVCLDGGHRFGTCGASGLAIRTPGTACMCGVCGTRTIRPAQLVAAVPQESRDDVMQVISPDSCGRCGGKFMD